MSAAAKKSADDEFNKLRAEYLESMLEKMATINSELLQWEKATETPNIYELKRLVHSIKGTGGMYEYPTLTAICHQFEDQIEAQENFPIAAVQFDSLYKFADLMTDFVNHFRPSANAEDNETKAKFAEALKSFRPSHIGTILVSDDSRTTQKIIAEMAKGLPVQVSFTNNGIVALGRLLHEDFDVFISGGTVAELGGMATIAAMKLERPDKKTTAILLSSNVNKFSSENNIGPDIIIPRGPKMMETLAADLNDIIAQKSLAA